MQRDEKYPSREGDYVSTEPSNQSKYEPWIQYRKPVNHAILTRWTINILKILQECEQLLHRHGWIIVDIEGVIQHFHDRIHLSWFDHNWKLGR